MNLWYPAFVYFRQRFGTRLQKISLDRPGASCPNRGASGQGGCIFCNPYGSGSGLAGAAPELETQWMHWQQHYGAKASLYMAYFQSFTNTHGPLEELRELLERAVRLPGIAGLALATRPDCLDEKKLELLAACPLPEVWLELGLQSAHEQTLLRIRRGHGVRASETAVHLAASYGLKVCGHLMAGLPGENDEDFLHSIRWAARLPLAGLKLHNVYVPRHTPLEAAYRAGEYKPLEQQEYVALAARALTLLPARLVIQRLLSDPAPDELVAPDWVRFKSQSHDAIRAWLAGHGQWQACDNDAPTGPPTWFA